MADAEKDAHLRSTAAAVTALASAPVASSSSAIVEDPAATTIPTATSTTSPPAMPVPAPDFTAPRSPAFVHASSSGLAALLPGGGKLNAWAAKDASSQSSNQSSNELGDLFRRAVWRLNGSSEKIPRAGNGRPFNAPTTLHKKHASIGNAYYVWQLRHVRQMTDGSITQGPKLARSEIDRRDFDLPPAAADLIPQYVVDRIKKSRALSKKCYVCYPTIKKPNPNRGTAKPCTGGMAVVLPKLCSCNSTQGDSNWRYDQGVRDLPIDRFYTLETPPTAREVRKLVQLIAGEGTHALDEYAFAIKCNPTEQEVSKKLYDGFGLHVEEPNDDTAVCLASWNEMVENHTLYKGFPHQYEIYAEGNQTSALTSVPPERPWSPVPDSFKFNFKTPESTKLEMLERGKHKKELREKWEAATGFSEPDGKKRKYDGPTLQHVSKYMRGPDMPGKSASEIGRHIAQLGPPLGHESGVDRIVTTAQRAIARHPENMQSVTASEKYRGIYENLTDANWVTHSLRQLLNGVDHQLELLIAFVDGLEQCRKTQSLRGEE